MKKRILSLAMSVLLLISLLPATARASEELPFTSDIASENGISITVTENGYTYTEPVYNSDWEVVDSVTHEVTLYTIPVPAGTQTDTLRFAEDRIAYGYDADGNYLSSCSEDAEAGYGSNGQEGEQTATVRPTAGGTLPAYVRVQTPYDDAWQSQTLYAIAYDCGEASPSTESKGTAPSAETLLHSIADAHTGSSEMWWLLDIAGYAELYPDSAVRSTEKARSSYLRSTLEALSEAELKDAEYAKAVLGLTAIGADVTRLYLSDAASPLPVWESWNRMEHSSSAWVAPYTLAAYRLYSGDDAAEYTQPLLDALLDKQQEDGSWSEWGTVDTTANVVAALALYRDNAAVSAAMERGLDYLSAQMLDDGTFNGGAGSDIGSNANSTAMVLLALAAAGVDPQEDSRFQEDGVSVRDGLLRFALEDGSGFGYLDASEYNEYATEQSFRALVAAERVSQTEAAYNIYDLSGTEVAPARAEESSRTKHTGSKTKTETEKSTTTPVETEPVAPSFSDVSAESPYAEGIAFCAAKGWMLGIGEDCFAPQQPLNRAMMAMVLYRMAGAPQADGAAAFADVPAEHYAAEAIAWCAAQGIVQGRTDGCFDPNALLRQDELAAMLYRYAKQQGAQGSAGGTGAQWSQAAMDWMADCRLLPEGDTAALAPGKVGSRAELAVLLQRFDEAVLRAEGGVR